MQEMSRLRVFRWRDPAFSLSDSQVAPLVMETAGWLLDETDDYIRIASERCPTLDEHRQFTVIPRSLLVDE